MWRKGDEPIPGYRLERFLGRGQFGEVWQSIAPGRMKVALKFIDLSGKQGAKELRGVQRVKEIRHPHLMPITALWMLDEEGHVLADEAFAAVEETTKGSVTVDAKLTLAVREIPRPQTLIVAMLLGQQNLSDRLADARRLGLPGIPISDLLRFMEEAAKGIDFLNRPQHDLGEGPVSIQHCDIKPANIMLLGDAAVVCDFGLARVLAGSLQATATGMVGSPAYMAPECIRRKPSQATDQYSLAISYVELRTGHLPFADESYMAVLDSHQTGELSLDHLPPAEAAVIRRATALEPAERFPNCASMVTALRAIASTDAVSMSGSMASLASSAARDTLPRRSTARTTDSAKTSADAPRRSRRWLLALAGLFLIGAASFLTMNWPAIQRQLVQPPPKPSPTTKKEVVSATPPLARKQIDDSSGEPKTTPSTIPIPVYDSKPKEEMKSEASAAPVVVTQPEPSPKAPTVEELLANADKLASQSDFAGARAKFEQAAKSANNLAEQQQIAEARRRAMQEVLDSIRKLGVPSDGDLSRENLPVPTDAAWELLLASRTLAEPPTPEWKAMMVRVGAFRERDRIEPAVFAELLTFVDELTNSAAEPWLEKYDAPQQLQFAAATLHAVQFAATNSGEDRWRAIDAFAKLLKTWFTPQWAQASIPDSQIYGRVVRPMLVLLKPPPIAENLNAGQCESAAAAWGTLGHLIVRDPTVAQQVAAAAKGKSADQVAYDAFHRAIEFSPQANYFVGQGWALTQLPLDDAQSRIDELETLAKRALELDGQSAGAHNLLAVALVERSRLAGLPERAFGLLADAVRAFRRAIELGNKEDALPSYLEGLSAAHLEAAFHSASPETRRPHLTDAVDAAKRALEFPVRRRPWNAHLCLGNALEDRAYYLKDDTFPSAIAAFEDAFQAAQTFGTTSQATKALLYLGRARQRFAGSERIAADQWEAELTQAETELRNAIEAWEQLPAKRETTDGIAQAFAFLSAACETRAKKGADTDELRRDWLHQADEAMEKGVHMAREAKAPSWARLQIAWADLAEVQARLSTTNDAPARAFSAQALERANAVLAEAASESLGVTVPMGLRRNALDIVVKAASDLSARIQAINQHLDLFPDDGGAGTQLRFEILLARGHMIAAVAASPNEWSAAKSTFVADLNWLTNATARLPSHVLQELGRAQLADLRGRVAARSSLVSTLSLARRRELWDEAVQHFGAALAAFGDDPLASAETRVQLALIHRQQLSVQVASEKPVLAERIRNLLEPITAEHVPAATFKIVESVRAEARTIIGE